MTPDAAHSGGSQWAVCFRGRRLSELSQTGLLLQLLPVKNDARLYLFTDASSKDASLAGSVIAAAQAKQIQITPLLFGSCLPGRSGLYQRSSGDGESTVPPQPRQASLTFSLIRPQLKGNLVPVIRGRNLERRFERVYRADRFKR